MQNSLRSEWELVLSILRSLRNPGPPPRYFVTAAISGMLVLLVGVLAIYLTAPDFNDAFQEGRSGTYFSVAYLLVDALACIVIARCLLVTPIRNDRWRIPFALLFGGMLALGVFGIVMSRARRQLV